MAIYGQPNRWQCGPFALKHALLALGRFAHEDELARLAGSSETVGTDEKGLGRAARAHGCDLGLIRHKKPEPARRALTEQLSRGVPALLCIDQWEHWVAVVGAQGDRFVVFDSHFEEPLRIDTWPTLGDRLAYSEQRRFGRRTLYDIHPLSARRPQRLRFRLTPPRAEKLLGTEHVVLKRDWDELARRVLGIGVPAGRQLEFGTPLASWIAADRDRIVDEAAHFSLQPDLVELRRTVDEIGFVASLYGVLLRPEDEPDAGRRLAVMAAARATRAAERRLRADGGVEVQPADGPALPPRAAAPTVSARAPERLRVS